MKFDGVPRGPIHPVWATYRHLIKNAKVFLNGSISVVEAEELLKDHTGDVIVFGRPWLVNPDFANRVIQGKPALLSYDFQVETAKHPLPLTIELSASVDLSSSTSPNIPRASRTEATSTGRLKPSTTSPPQSF